MLKGKTIILGVTGGIAAYKALELLRLYIKAGAEVHVVMTKAACEFVTPLSFQALSGHPVHTELFDLHQESEIGHISLADRADLFVIAPATANTIGKIACGLADDLLSTTVMATKAPVLLVPAMNVNMLENPIYRKNEARLAELGYHIMEPETGFLACGWEGRGKFPDPAAVFERTLQVLAPKDLAGQIVLVTAGPTREEIDPVRYVSNYSSGKMGYAIARQAYNRGARVVLVSGPTCLPTPCGVETVRVVSARQMREEVMKHAGEATVIIKAAAVADYRPKAPVAGKMKKEEQGEEISLVLEKNPDILAELGAVKKKAVLVGFAAETSDLIRHAREKLLRKNLDLIVANDVTQEGAGFDGDTNIVRLLFPDGRVEELPRQSKDEVAGHLLDTVLDLLTTKN